MMKVLISLTNTRVAFMTVQNGADVEAEIKRFKATYPNLYTSHEVVEDDIIPPDRTFRNAWEFSNGSVVVSMAKAREIHRSALRVMRAPKLEALDIAYMRADEEGNSALKADITAKKQALRDVTDYAAIDAAQTPDQLKQAIPAILTE